jgi:hypothetical protein
MLGSGRPNSSVRVLLSSVRLVTASFAGPVPKFGWQPCCDGFSRLSHFLKRSASRHIAFGTFEDVHQGCLGAHSVHGLERALYAPAWQAGDRFRSCQQRGKDAAANVFDN